MDRPLVSILVAAYDPHPPHFTAALDSAIGQTWPDLQILVSDDSPGTAVKAMVRAAGDPRVEYVHHVPSLGTARNHWWCLGQARGEFVAILNHDDFFEPRCIEILTSALLQHPSAAVAFCDHWIADSLGRRSVVDSEKASSGWGRTALRAGLHEPFFSLLAAQTIPMAMGAVFRKSCLPERLPPEAGPAYDLWLTYLLSRQGSGAYFVPERLSSWRQHEGNLTSQGGDAWLAGAADCWSAVAADPVCASIRDIAAAKAKRGFAALSFKALAAGRSEDAFRFARRSLQVGLSPRGLAAWALAQSPSTIAASLLRVRRCRRLRRTL